MPLHSRLHIFQLLVECTANQALSTLCHSFHVYGILQLLQPHQQNPPPPDSETMLELSGEVTAMPKAAVSLIPQLDTRISAGRFITDTLPAQWFPP